MGNIAISYARFSSAGQAEGRSLSRQVERAEQYAAANDLTLDHRLSFRDLGVSAWDRSNVDKGALGLFVKAIQDVPAGATLIVEAFDRLSRAEPIDALAIFQQIIAAGLNLVTLTEPPKRFNRQTLHGQPVPVVRSAPRQASSECRERSQARADQQVVGEPPQRAVESKAVMTSRDHQGRRPSTEQEIQLDRRARQGREARP